MIYMAYNFWAAYAENVINLKYFFWFLVYLVFFVAGIMMPAIIAKRAIRRHQKRALGQPLVIVRQFGDRIIDTMPGSVMTLDYCNIKKVYSLKTCYVIRFTDNIALLILARDGFTKGTFEEFKQFLREKRPDLKIPE